MLHILWGVPCFCIHDAREHKKLDPDATTESRACAVQWSKEEFAKYGHNSKVASKIQEPAYHHHHCTKCP